MRIRSWWLFLLVTIFFFWPVFLKNFTPFPGDLLIAEYAPWSTYSYLGYAGGAYPHKAQYFDTLRQIYPWKTLSLELLKKGEWPLWNPHNFSGAPLLANFQSAVFYPLNLFYFLLPAITAWTLLVMLQPLLAGWFTYLFGRQIGLKKSGAFLAGIAFSFSGFMAVFLEYNLIGQTVLWLPLSAYFFEKQLQEKRFGWFLGLALSLAMLFLAGHLPSAGLAFVFLLVYFFFRKGLNLKIIILAALGLATAGVQLLPTAELISQSARVAHSYRSLIDALLIQPKQLLMLLVPDFFGNPAARNYLLGDTYVSKVTYIGLVPLVLAVLAFFGQKKSRRFFSLASLALLGLMTAWPLTRFLYRFKIPLLLTSAPTNAIFLLAFCLAILAGMGIDEWLKTKQKQKWLALVIPGVIFLLLWFFSEIGLVKASQRNLLYSSLVFLALVVVSWVLAVKRQLLMIALIALTIADLFYFFHKFNPFVPRDLVYPEATVLSWLQKNTGFDRFWGYGSAKIDANFASQYRLFSPDGYDPLYPRRYGEFIYSSREGRLLEKFNDQTRSDAEIAPGFGEDDLPNNPYRQKVLDLLGTRFVLDKVNNQSTEKTFPPDRYRLVWQDQDWFIFENLMAAPRAFLVGEYQIFKNNQDFEEQFFSPDFEIRKTLLLEAKPIQEPAQAKTSEAAIVDYTVNQVILKTESDADQLLFLSDVFYPGWQASVDGQPTEIYRANYAFRAVPVPAGEHQILFRYQPQSFPWGVKISLISLGLILVFSFWWREK